MSICVLLNRPCFGCCFQCLSTKPCLGYSQRNSRISFQCVVARMLLFMMMTNMLLACRLCSCYVYIPLVERVGSHSLYLLLLGRPGRPNAFFVSKNIRLIYPLVICYIAMVKPCPIEIDGLPFLKMVDLSMANC